MTEQVRQRIVTIISTWIRENGNMPLRMLKSTLKAKGIPEFVVSSIQPKQWIANGFPEFKIVGTNGYEHIANVASDKVLQALLDAVSKEGKCLLSNVSPLLSNVGVEWRTLANGKKLYEWILDAYPGVFTVSEDLLSLSMADSPVQATPSYVTVDQETRNFVYRFCYMPASASILKLIKELTGDDSINQTKWACQRNYAMAQCLIGLNGGLLDDSAGEVPRMAYYTGLKTPKDQEIYGVLSLNPNKGVTQKWIFSTVTFPGQDTEEGYWLCNAFGIKSQAAYGEDRSILLDSAAETLNKVSEIQNELSCGQMHIQHYIDNGEVLPDVVAELVKEYIRCWAELKSILQKLGGDQPAEFMNISDVQQYLAKLNDSSRLQDDLIEKFTALAHETWTFFQENMLCPNDCSADDIASWECILQNNNMLDSVSLLRQQLAPYQAITVLRAFNPVERGVLDDAEYSAIDDINEHFKARLKLAQLRHSICNKEIDMRFLDLILEIKKLLTEIESEHRKTLSASALPSGDSDLLDAAYEGWLWKISANAFRKPNALEMAIMLGDTKSAQEVIYDPDALHALGYDASDEKHLIESAVNMQLSKAITPLFAAERLIQCVGRASEVVDQCLLLSVLLREDGAFEAMIQHYIETERPALAGFLFERVKTLLPVEIRRRIVLSLVSLNCISIDSAIRDDMPALLTEAGIQLVKTVEMDEELRGRLLELYNDIQPTFINHIVFLSPELQSYTLRPENADELKGYIWDKKREDIAELFRQNTLERGNSPLQIARRLSAFIGSWGDVALEFAQFSENNFERRDFLFNLLLEKGDDLAIFRFMNENSDIRQMHLSYYYDLMFRNQMFSEICSKVRNDHNNLSTKQILQWLLSSIMIGEPISAVTEFDNDEAIEYPELLIEISEGLYQYDHEIHKAFLVSVFPGAIQVFGEPELERLVTADGILGGDEMARIADAVVECCPALAIYYGRLMKSSAHEALADSYISARYRTLATLDLQAQKNLAHELRILAPEKYMTLEENILNGQLNEILESEIEIDKKASAISELLRTASLTGSAFSQALSRIEENSVFCHATLYRSIPTYIKENHALTEYLELACSHWEKGDEEYKIFFCNQVIDADNRRIIPNDLLIKYESCLLEMSDSLNRRKLLECVLHMEEIRSREPYYSFVKNLLDDATWSESSYDLVPPDREGLVEIALICDALEDDAVDIDEYFRYCSRLIASAERSINADLTIEGGDTLIVLRQLYQHSDSADIWDAFERMIPQSRIRARGLALYYYAHYLGEINSEQAWMVEKNNDKRTVGKANTAWERCVNYCITEDLDDLFFTALHAWLHEINNYYVRQFPWYAAKHYMQTLQKILEDSDSVLHGDCASVTSFPICTNETALSIVSEAINVFKRIDQNKTNQISGDDNHNSLRVIIELSLRLECEDLLLEKLSEELSGAYVNLGLVVVCRLLLIGKTQSAMHFLNHIIDAPVKNYNYSFLMDSLAAMGTEEELKQWMSVESNRATLRFILPNGNAPDLFRLQTLIMGTFSGDASICENSVRVVENLIDCYPRDVMIYKSLFIMCKENYFDYLPHIYRALVGIYKNYHTKPRNMYTRERLHILNLVEILRQVMEQMEIYNVVYESTTDLIRGYSHENDRVNMDELVSKLNQLSEEIKNLFVGIGKNTDEYSLLTKSLLGSVTENWVPFFREAYRLQTTGLTRVYNVDKYKSTRGMLRGALRAWHECATPEEQEAFMTWINREIARDPDSLFSKLAMKQMNNLINKTNLRAINWSMLRLPWEEHLVCLGNLKDLGQPEKNCCYKVMMAERPRGQSAKDSFIVMIRVAQDILKAQLLIGNSRAWFYKGDYDLAYAAYYALAITRILPTNDRAKVEVIYETYETWMRISSVFAGAELNSKSCSPHSCMNMICALINAGYVKYYDRLRVFFSGVNLKLFRAVRRVLATPLYDEDAYKMLDDFHREHGKEALIAFMHFLLSQDQTGRYLFLSNTIHIDNTKRRLTLQEESLSSSKRNKYWISLQSRPLPSVFPAEDDENTDYMSDEVPVSSAIGTDNEAFMPRCYDEVDSFAMDDDGRDLQSLLDEYHSLTPYSDNDCSKRLRLAALIVVRCRHNASEIERQKSLVRFGINYYKYYYNCVRRNVDVEQSAKRIHSTMLDLGIYGLQIPSANAEIVLFLPNWFQYAIRGFSSIDQLLRDYAQNRAAYASIIKLLSDTEYSNTANSLIEVLNMLLSATSRFGENALDIRSYQMAQSRLSEVSPSREWVEMYAALNEMLRQAINKLDQQPSLKVTLFNAGIGLINDGLYGEIENTGRETAYRLELQATFPNNSRQPMSGLYRLPSLRPNEKATFAINYSASESLLEMEYILSLSYVDKEKRCAIEPLHDRLTIVSSSVPEHTVPPKFETHNPSAFTVDEQGNIISQDFRGRKSELQRLSALLNGDDFSHYHSAIVQGIKRSGKTSLLNYLRTFIRGKKAENTIHVFFDCQALASKPYIYKVFFKSVLDELPLEMPQIMSHPDWESFSARWRLTDQSVDRDPADLSLFFRQLHGMMDGKGLYLIIDEFDKLIAKLDGDIGYDALLQSLRSLQMNPDCMQAVHMVLSGSNQLLIYNQTGSFVNQMFQSYGTIPVGQMLASDIQLMITDWLEQHPIIRFADAPEGGTSPSIQWIERYTGGLVWYTRLLVNEAVRLVIADNRDCVYPSDISSAFNSIVNYHNCRQLVEGCGRDEEIVIDALQSLSDRPGMYVSFENLMQRLEPFLSAEQVRRSLNMLTESLELIEQKSPGIRSYRFRIELYRRYFRTLLWLDNHESRFAGDRTSDQQNFADCFTIVESEANIETVDSNSAFDHFI